MRENNYPWPLVATHFVNNAFTSALRSFEIINAPIAVPIGKPTNINGMSSQPRYKPSLIFIKSNTPLRTNNIINAAKMHSNSRPDAVGFVLDIAMIMVIGNAIKKA